MGAFVITSLMYSRLSITQLLFFGMVLFAALAATDPSIERQELEEISPTALPTAEKTIRTNFADGQETNEVKVPEAEAAAMEEVQGRSEAQSEEASQAGWGSRRRRRRRRRRRWWGSHHERHQKNVARERANKERSAKEKTSKERSVKAKERSVKAKAPKKWKWGRKYKKKSGKLYRMRVLYRKPGNKWLATNKKYWRRVMWSWRRTYRKKGKYLYRKRAMYAYSKKSTKQGTVVRWIRTKYYRWVMVQWRWTRHTKVKKGVSYRRQGMYGYSKTKKRWYRTNRIRWRRATLYKKTKKKRKAMSMEEVSWQSKQKK